MKNRDEEVDWNEKCLWTFKEEKIVSVILNIVF